MVDTTPDHYVAEFMDGPAEGERIRMTHRPFVMLWYLDSHQDAVRYECDVMYNDDEGGEVCRMVLSRNPEDFDADIKKYLEK